MSCCLCLRRRPVSLSGRRQSDAMGFGLDERFPGLQDFIDECSGFPFPCSMEEFQSLKSKGIQHLSTGRVVIEGSRVVCIIDKDQPITRQGSSDIVDRGFIIEFKDDMFQKYQGQIRAGSIHGRGRLEIFNPSISNRFRRTIADFDNGELIDDAIKQNDIVIQPQLDLHINIPRGRRGSGGRADSN